MPKKYIKTHQTLISMVEYIFCEYFKTKVQIWLSGRVVMQRPAKPSTPVRFRPQPQMKLKIYYEH